MTALSSQIERAEPTRRLPPDLVAWIVVAVFVVFTLFVQGRDTIIQTLPETFFVPLDDWINLMVDWFLQQFRWLFRGITDIVEIPLIWLRTFFRWVPWPATMIAGFAIGFAAGGLRLGLFTAAAIGYVVLVGYWDKTAMTLSLAAIAVPLSLAVGLFAGILADRHNWCRRLIEPILDLMQTVPTFAYLVPIMVLFGVGPVVGILASAIYAIPPMARNVLLGLERVPVEIVESAKMSGSTRRQLLWWVKIPAAMPTILMGVNQTIMATLSMVVIAAMLGGINDIGLEVFVMMKRAAFGESLLAGFVIVLLAMVLDKLSRGFAERNLDIRIADRGAAQRRQVLWAALAAIILLIIWAEFNSNIREFPREWVWYPAEPMNQALSWFTVRFFDTTSAIKSSVIFFFLLPLKLGLDQAVHPRFWGFEFTPLVKLAYVTGVAAIATVAGWFSSWRVAIGISLAGLIYLAGTTNIPWLALIAIVVLLGYQTGGWKVAVLAALGLGFIAFTGSWNNAMLSLQLSGAGVLIAFVLGSSLGVWAALSDRVSRILRPINDTLQTMPIFIFLIPGIMIFLVGEFTGLIAIVMYATVPSIRYTEHGIRNVPAHVVESARSFGTTKLQLLFQVQLPMALPEIMLGLNQTIMMGLAMVVVAALVGAAGLGSEIMIGITRGDTGIGMVAGLSIALIAIITDQIIQKWSAKKRKALGL